MWKKLSCLLGETANFLIRIRVCLLLLAIFLAACSAKPSNKYNTSGLHLVANVTADGTGTTTVFVEIHAGSNIVLLESGDTLTVTAYGTTKTLVNTGTTYSPVYETRFQRDDPEEQFTFNLTRSSDNVSAPDTNVKLPAAFEILSPGEGQQFASGDSIQVTWNNNDADTQIMIGGKCTGTGNPTPTPRTPISLNTSSSAGSISVNILQQLLNNSALTTGETCLLEVSLVQVAQGTADSNFENGSVVVAKQVRKVEGILITP